MFADLLFGSSTAHIIFILAATIALGTLLGKVKIGGITLGVTWILFVGIALGHFGMGIDPKVLGFVKEFGLILFIYSVGLQVGPGFFASLKQNGIRLNVMALCVLLLGIGVTLAIGATDFKQFPAGFPGSAHNRVFSGYLHDMPDDIFPAHGVPVFVFSFLIV